MKNKLILLVISAVLLSLSYPIFNFEFLAWIAFIPLFFALQNQSRFEAFKLSYLCGLIFFGITIYWLIYVSVLAYILLILILALFFGLFAFLIRSTIHHPPSTILFTIPAIWVLVEYIRTHLFTGFGWALLGYSQYLNLPLIQIADKTGVWGTSFIVMMVNVAVFRWLKDGFKKAKPVVITTILILGLTFLYGWARLSEKVAFSKLITISVIQGNIPQHQKWDESFKEEILTKYEKLTIEAAETKPDLIIWPETALPGYMEEEDLQKKVRNLAKKVKIPLLIGAPSVSDYEEEKPFNSAFLISEDGEIIARHEKMHLVPFGEYIPFQKNLAFLRRFINKRIGNFNAGKEYTIFKLKNNYRFGVLICFEDIFPNLVRNFVDRDADFVVNMTNDAWFMDSSEPYQHAQASVFRAVENRIPVVRAANTGLSCFINSKGRITDRVEVNGKDTFVEGFKTSRVYLR